MAIRYEEAPDLFERISDIVKTLGMEHIRLSGIHAFRSYGSDSRGTIARCHALGKLWQRTLGIDAVYLIEVINERFGKMSSEDQDKVLIHELLHIPLSFGGGFKHHDFVCEKNVDKLHRKYKELKGNNSYSDVNHVKHEINKHEINKKGFGRWF